MFQVLTPPSSDYPSLLREVRRPPAKLYVRGDPMALKTTCFAIVGTRANTAYGKSMAEYFTRGLVSYGFTIVSGLAYGIDAIVHETTLECGGKTIAVLGSGVDRVHPSYHEHLAERIIESGGALVSEYEPGTLPYKSHFPARNRIISGICVGTLIIEAPEKSGALITARRAFEQNRDVFAIPGDLTRATTQGNHYLVCNEMAHLVRTPEDIISRLHHQPKKVLEKLLPRKDCTPQGALELSTPAQKKVWNELSRSPLPVEDLFLKTGLSISEVLVALSYLELKGYVQEADAGRYMRRMPP